MTRQEMTARRHEAILAAVKSHPELSVAQIAQKLGVDRSNIYWVMRKNGIGLDERHTLDIASRGAKLEVK